MTEGWLHLRSGGKPKEFLQGYPASDLQTRQEVVLPVVPVQRRELPLHVTTDRMSPARANRSTSARTPRRPCPRPLPETRPSSTTSSLTRLSRTSWGGDVLRSGPRGFPRVVPGLCPLGTLVLYCPTFGLLSFNGAPVPCRRLSFRSPTLKVPVPGRSVVPLRP